MAMIDDINVFKDYIMNTYGKEIKVDRFMDELLMRDSEVIDIWATAVAEYFNCSKDKLFKKGRQGNCQEKIWLQYFLVVRESLSPLKIHKMFYYKDYTTIYSNIRSCSGYRDVYPEIHDGIVAVYDREIAKLNLNKQIKIVV